MKSLREEIKAEIYMIAGDDKVAIRWVDCDKITNAVMSKIEKQINEIYLNTSRTDKDNWKYFYQGFDKALELVKFRIKADSVTTGKWFIKGDSTTTDGRL